MRMSALVGGVLLASICMGSAGGCINLTPDARVERAQLALGFVEEKAADLQSVVLQFEAALVTAKTILADPNLPPEMQEKWTAAVVTLEGELAKYRPAVTALDETVRGLRELVATAQTAAGGALDLSQELNIYGRALMAGSAALPKPIGAYVALIGLALTLISGSIGAFAQKKKDSGAMQKQADQALTNIHGIVSSVNALLQSDAVPNPAAARDVLKAYQVENCPEARVAVRQAQGIIA